MEIILLLINNTSFQHQKSLTKWFSCVYLKLEIQALFCFTFQFFFWLTTFSTSVSSINNIMRATPGFFSNLFALFCLPRNIILDHQYVLKNCLFPLYDQEFFMVQANYNSATNYFTFFLQDLQQIFFLFFSHSKDLAEHYLQFKVVS